MKANEILMIGWSTDRDNNNDLDIKREILSGSQTVADLARKGYIIAFKDIQAIELYLYMVQNMTAAQWLEETNIMAQLMSEHSKKTLE